MQFFRQVLSPCACPIPIVFLFGKGSNFLKLPTTLLRCWHFCYFNKIEKTYFLLSIKTSNVIFYLPCVIFIDSLWIILGEPKHPYILHIRETYTEIVKLQKSIVLDWILSHVGTSDNEIAGKLAKYARNITAANIKMHHTDFRDKMKELIKWKWQTKWDSKSNKLYNIQRILEKQFPCFKKNKIGWNSFI